MILALVEASTIDLAGSAHDSASVTSSTIDSADGAHDFNIGSGIDN